MARVKQSKNQPHRCPCDRGEQNVAYQDCCAPCHQGIAAADALTLMRARYSAYVLGRDTFLRESWHASTRPPPDRQLTDPGTRWLGLRVLSHETPKPTEAYVEFVARYRVGGQSAVRLHERSRFVCENGHWYYLSGTHPPNASSNAGE